MYMARINNVMEQDNMYSVSFLKQHTDGSYYWTDKEYINFAMWMTRMC